MKYEFKAEYRSGFTQKCLMVHPVYLKAKKSEKSSKKKSFALLQEAVQTKTERSSTIAKPQ